MTTYLFRALLLTCLVAVTAACNKDQPTGTGDPAAQEPAAAEPAATDSAETETAPVAAEPEAQTDAAAEAEAQAEADDRRQRPERDPEVETAQMIHDIWWNSPEIYAALDLGEDQRSAMDGFLADYAETQRLRTEATPELMEQYRAAVGAGDFEEGRRLSAEMADIAGKGMSANFDLQLSVLGLLSAEQLEKAIADYPGMMARQWVRGRRVMGGQQLGRNPGAERGTSAQGQRRMGQGQSERRQGQGMGRGTGQGRNRAPGQQGKARAGQDAEQGEADTAEGEGGNGG